MVSEAGALLLSVGLDHHVQEKDKRFGTPCVTAEDSYLPRARNITGSGGGTRLWKLRGMNLWQGTPRSEELGGK